MLPFDSSSHSLSPHTDVHSPVYSSLAGLAPRRFSATLNLVASRSAPSSRLVAYQIRQDTLHKASILFSSAFGTAVGPAFKPGTFTLGPHHVASPCATTSRLLADPPLLSTSSLHLHCSYLPSHKSSDMAVGNKVFARRSSSSPPGRLSRPPSSSASSPVCSRTSSCTQSPPKTSATRPRSPTTSANRPT